MAGPADQMGVLKVGAERPVVLARGGFAPRSVSALSQPRAQSSSPSGESFELATLAEIFGSYSEERLDAATRERLLERLLAEFSEAAVAAFDANGIFMEMPDTIPIGERPVIEGRSGLDGAKDDEGRNALFAAWGRMLNRGVGRYRLKGADFPDVNCYWLDLRERHGVIFALFQAADPAEVQDSTSLPLRLEAPTPRMAAMRKSNLAEIIGIDKNFTAILGWELKELEGKRSLDLIHPDDRDLAVENWVEMISRPGPARRLRQRLSKKDGTWVWFEVTNHNLLDDPDYQCVVAELVDISEEMAREQLLDRLTAALPVGVLQIDSERQVVFTNERLHTILGVPPAGTLEAQLGTVVAADVPLLDRAIKSVLQEGANADIEVRILVPETEDLRRCTLSIRALGSEEGSVSGAIACVDDVTDRARMQDELKRRATYDDLTGCHNRTSIVAALEETIASGRGKAERAVMFLDLDGFKEVNDRHGHAAGDELLHSVAARLLDAVRGTDLVGRIGGDEFLVVCPDIGGPAAAMRLAERVAGAITHPAHAITPGEITPQVSIGVAWSSGRSATADWLVAMADRAMYESKHIGEGRPVLASSAQSGGALPVK